MRYHVIDSVKGGCGKSTLAIMLAAAISIYQKKEDRKSTGEENNESEKENKELKDSGKIKNLEESRKTDKKIPVCIFDMDLQGTSMAYLLFGKNWKKNRKLPSKMDIYLNERIKNSDTKGKRFIKKVVWGMDLDGDLGERSDADENVLQSEFYVAVSSPIQEDKDQYKPRSSQNYSPGVSYGRFRYGLSKLLTSENLCEELKEKLEHVILDMPPNSDGYSDAVTDFLLDAKGRGLVKGDSCSYFLMVTRDLAHQQATLEWLNVFLSHESNRKYLDRLVITLADTPRDIRMADEKVRDDFKEWVRQFSESLKSMTNWKEELIKKTCFVAVNFNAEYYELCCKNDGIINNTVNINNPIKYMQVFDGEMNADNATEKFLELLCE